MLPSKPHLIRGMSFNESTGAKESASDIWDASPFTKLEKSKGRMMDRANSFITKTTTTTSNCEGAIAVVDPFSTGAHLASQIVRQGVKCVSILSIWDSPVASLVQDNVECEFCATIQHNDREEDQNAATNAVRYLICMSFDLSINLYLDCESIVGVAISHYCSNPRCGDRCGVG